MPPIHEWESFYVIIGSSAAALTGLMFVVIALMSDARAPRNTEALEAFATPTIVHFCAVLLISAFITMPRDTIASLRISFIVCGVAGFVYVTWITIQARRQTAYVPEIEDWLFHSILPLIAYASLLVAGLMLGLRGGALFGVGTSALMLLFIGIHNAWDSAVWMMMRGESVKTDEQQIRDVIDRWRKASEASDLQTVLSLMTDDVVFLTPGQPPMTKEAFASAFKSGSGRTQMKASQEIKEIYVGFEIAYCWSNMSVTMDGKTRSGHILTIFRKRGDGSWLLSRDANLLMANPASA